MPSTAGDGGCVQLGQAKGKVRPVVETESPTNSVEPALGLAYRLYLGFRYLVEPAVALLMLIVLSPLMGLIALLIKLDSPGLFPPA